MWRSFRKRGNVKKWMIWTWVGSTEVVLFHPLVVGLSEGAWKTPPSLVPGLQDPSQDSLSKTVKNYYFTLLASYHISLSQGPAGSEAKVCVTHRTAGSLSFSFLCSPSPQPPEGRWWQCSWGTEPHQGLLPWKRHYLIILDCKQTGPLPLGEVLAPSPIFPGRLHQNKSCWCFCSQGMQNTDPQRTVSNRLLRSPLSLWEN